MTLLRFTATPYTILLVATATVLVMFALGVLRSLPRTESRSRRPAVLLIAIQFVTAVWCVAYALQLSSPTASAAAFWNNVRLPGPLLAAPLSFLFVAEYTGRDAWFRTRRLLALFSVGIVTVPLAWTNASHGLIRGGIARSPSGSLFTDVSIGPWSAVYASYNYVLLLGAFVMLGLALRDRNRSRVYRGQAGMVLLALLAPTAANALYVLGLTRFDGTSVTFAVSGIAFAVSVYRYGLLDIVPIARSTVFETADLAIFVVDSNGTTVDANAPATRLVGPDVDAIVGTPLAELFSDQPAVADRLDGPCEGNDGVPIGADGDRRWFDVDVSTVRDSTGHAIGRVLMFNDVTERRRRQRELRERTAQLERQNEQLDQFAGIVSHDLRNPLNVAQGYLDVAREASDPEALDEIEVSLDRMEEIIEDILALARQSGEIDDAEPIDLAALAAESWNTVDTRGASLVVETERTVVADRTRLRHLFENLFRNALEHGSTSPPSRAQEDIGRRSAASEPSVADAPEDGVEHGSTGSRPQAEDSVEHSSAGPASRAQRDAIERGSISPASQAQQDAVAHGPAVTVRIGDLDTGSRARDAAGRGVEASDETVGGFFVEDDGPGIPSDARETVFDRGYTTNDDGTGFGLAIAKATVEAHDWSIRVTEGSDGGARFEVEID